MQLLHLNLTQLLNTFLATLLRSIFFDYQYKETIHITTLVTGIGAVATTFGIAKTKEVGSYDLIVNVGIAGAYSRSFSLGDVLEITKDKFADLGAYDSNGDLHSIYDIGLENPDKYPYTAGCLSAKNIYQGRLKAVTGITVNSCTGSQSKADELSKKHDADLESMEAAAVIYTAKMLDIDCIVIRSVSNYVEDRNKENWEISLALSTLGMSVSKFITETIA